MTTVSMQDEIDLQPYILMLVRSWKLILVITVLAAGMMLVYNLLSPRTYSASATILLTRIRSQLSLATQFPTVTEPFDQKSRIDALMSITQDTAIAAQTFAAVKTDLPANNTIIDLQQHVKISNKGDAILVTATAESPGLASKIANIWAGLTVAAINRAYNDVQPLSEIQPQLASSQQDYEKSQAALEDFLKNNQVTLLQGELNDAKNGFNQFANTRSQEIQAYTQRKLALDSVIAQMEALKSQISSSSKSAAGGAGDALAVLQARALTFGVNSPALNLTGQNPTQAYDSTHSALTFNLQVSDLKSISESGTAYSQDLDILIQGAKAEKDRNDQILENLASQVASDQLTSEVSQTNKRIQDLETALEKETARQRELTSQRDLTWKAYQALLEKSTEIRNTTQSNDQVSLATSAESPQTPEPRGTVTKTAAAGFAGLMLSVLLVFGMEWWKTLKL